MIAIALLVVVHGERTVSTAYDVPLELRLPARLAAATPVPVEVSVSVSGPWARIRGLDGESLGPVIVDLRRAGPGEAAWFVKSEALRLPRGVRVDSIYPSHGTVELRAKAAALASP